MEGKLTPKEKSIYKNIDKESYKRFIEESDNLPLDSSDYLLIVNENIEYILELTHSIEVPKEFDHATRFKAIIIDKASYFDGESVEDAKTIIDYFNELVMSAREVVES